MLYMLLVSSRDSTVLGKRNKSGLWESVFLLHQSKQQSSPGTLRWDSRGPSAEAQPVSSTAGSPSPQPRAGEMHNLFKMQNLLRSGAARPPEVVASAEDYKILHTAELSRLLGCWQSPWLLYLQSPIPRKLT